jgi:two-component system nitrate/nitrite response regulator NarL
MRRGGVNEATPIALVADADDLARSQLAGLLASIGYAVIELAGGEEVLAASRPDVPALVVLDVGLPGVSAYEVCRELRDAHGQQLPIAFVSQHRTEPADEVAALLLGADEYFAKPLRRDLFLAKIRRLRARTKPRRAAASALTPREREVLGLLVEGVAPPEIAVRLCITDKTTATHIERILGKLGAHSRAQAVAFAVRDGLVEAAA